MKTERCKLLRQAQTAEDFDAMKHLIINKNEDTLHLSVKTPAVLRAYLLFVAPLDMSILCKIFYCFAYDFRVDMMAVLIPDYLTFNDLLHQNGARYSSYVITVVERGYVDVTKFLLDNGVSVDAIEPFHRTDCSLLHATCNMENVDVIDVLLERGANVNFSDKYGRTPAFEAVRAKDINVLSRLIMAGADLTARDSDGNTLWHVAIPSSMLRKRSKDIFQFLHDMRVPTGEGLIECLIEHREMIAPPNSWCEKDAVLKEIIAIMRSAGAEEPEEDVKRTDYIRALLVRK